MPEFSVSSAKAKALNDRLERLGVKPEDLVEKFIKGSGPGGQKINKTSSCVYLEHVPSGIQVKCQRTRSQTLNRYYARQELCDALEAKILGEKTKKQMEHEKIRRQKRRRSRKQKERMLENKKQRGEVKKTRKKPVEEG